MHTGYLMVNRKSNPDKFIILLLVVTVLPFLVAPFLQAVYADTFITQQIFSLLLLVGGGHQVASMYLYIDREAKNIINRHKLYFYFGPFVIALSCSIFFMLDNKLIENYFWTAFAMITIFHYQKQNIGVYSLLAPVVGIGRMVPIERFLIMGGAIVGMLVFGWPIGQTLFHGTVLFPFEGIIKNFSLLLLCSLTLFTIFYVFKNYLWIKKTQRQLLRGLILLGLVTFFWPMFVIEDKLTAFFMFASAHALQYFVFIVCSATNGNTVQQLLNTDHKKGVSLRWFNLAIFIVLTGFLMYLWKQLGNVDPFSFLLFTENEMKKAVLGFSTSITLIHYWVDSRIWKMRYADSREFVRSKFNFLF